MAKIKRSYSVDGDMSVGLGGIREPLVVPEGGHEGARAASEYQTMAEGRIVVGDKPADKFVAYDSALDTTSDT